MSHFRISRLDKNNWMLEELIEEHANLKTNKVIPARWETIGYYGKLSDLAVYLPNRQIEVPAGTLETQVAELLTAIKAAEARITAELKAMLEPIAE